MYTTLKDELPSGTRRGEAKKDAVYTPQKNGVPSSKRRGEAEADEPPYSTKMFQNDVVLKNNYDQIF